MRARQLALLLAVGLYLGLAAPALAGSAKVYDPPGKAGANEYAEVIPSSGGNVSTPALGGGNTTATAISKLGAGGAGVKALAKLGKQGAGAAQFAQETAPTPAPVPTPTAGGGSRSRARPKRAPLLRAPAASALSGFARLLGGGGAGGIGAALPVLLACGLAAAVGFMLARARGDRAPRA